MTTPKTAAEWAVSLCPWAKPGHYPQMDGSDRRCCKKCQPIEQALKLYALEQMGPMVEAMEPYSCQEPCSFNLACCVARKALTHYTRLKEEMNERS